VSRVVLTGATGLIGRHLAAALAARGDEPILLSRRSQLVAGIPTLRWDPEIEPIPARAVAGARAIVNLAGEPIGAGRWNSGQRRRIRESRETTTRRCVDALGGAGPRVLVSASAVGYYGSTEAPVDELSPPGDDFLATTCVRWEEIAKRGADRARVVSVRTGIVLARDGGVLPRLVQVTRLGAAGPLGSGRQWMSWIHVDDHVAVLLAGIDDDELSGPVNAVAPEPVRQRDFARVLARLEHRPSLLPTPAAVLRLVLGQMADLVLLGQRVVPSVLAARGSLWRFPTLGPALGDLVAEPTAAELVRPSR